MPAEELSPWDSEPPTPTDEERYRMGLLYDPNDPDQLEYIEDFKAWRAIEKMRGFPPFSQGRKAKRSKRIQNKTPEPGEAGPSSFGSSARELEFGEAGKDTEVIVISDTDDDDDDDDE